MSPEDTRHLNAFLKAFDAQRLGEGDIVAGANLLAAKAISIANIHRPGSGLVTANGTTLAVGSSLLVSGSLSTSLIHERVLVGLASRQNNFGSRLRQRSREFPNEFEPAGLIRINLAGNAMEHPEEYMMEALCVPAANQRRANANPDAPLYWAAVVKSSPQTDLRDLHDRPVLFITGTTPAQVAAQLERCHQGRPLVHLGVDDQKDFARFGDICPALMEGRMTVGSNAEIIRGNLFITDPNGALGETTSGDTPSSRWLSQMPWLVDGDAGPEPEEHEDDDSVIALNDVGRRYELAVGMAWGKRINLQSSEPELLEVEFAEAQVRWVTFLKGKEREFSGITGTARSLYATLVFGFHQMVSARVPTGFKLVPEQVEAFAKFLIQRMVNARSSILRTAGSARKLRLEESLLRKLAERLMGVRDLTRRFYKLPAEECRELLHDLWIEGRVTHSNGRWRLKPMVFLLVEDDPNDVFFVQREFQSAPANARLVHVGDARPAIEYLGGGRTLVLEYT